MISAGPTPGQLVSRARNGEDVVLARAFRHTPSPRYLELFSGDEPVSSLAALLEVGWSGTAVSVDHPDLIPAAIAKADPGTELHVLSADSLAALEAGRVQLGQRGVSPWVLVIRADSGQPGRSTPLVEDLIRGFRHTLYTGESDVFLSCDHDELAAALSYPPGPADSYRTANEAALANRLQAAETAVSEWQAVALEGWNRTAVLPAEGSAAQELDALKNSVSWRITRPIRAVRSRVSAGLHG